MSVTFKHLNSYPHDSVITSVEQVTIDGATVNIPVGDRPYSAATEAALLAACYSDGIINGFDVTYSDGIATVTKGLAIIGGKRIENPETAEMTLDAGNDIKITIDNTQASRSADMTAATAVAEPEQNVLILCSRNSEGAFFNRRGTAFCPLSTNILLGAASAMNQIVTGGYVASPFSATNTVFAALGYKPKKIEIYGDVFFNAPGKMEIIFDGRTNAYKCVFAPTGNTSFTSAPSAIVTATDNGITISGSNAMFNYESFYTYTIFKQAESIGTPIFDNADTEEF